MRARFAQSILARDGIEAAVISESNFYTYFQRSKNWRRRDSKWSPMLKKSRNKNDD